jgi:cellulose synthase/poly-beta-1,6-N-acetylglucosamine synthase-like glycosyltransferase
VSKRTTASRMVPTTQTIAWAIVTSVGIATETYLFVLLVAARSVSRRPAGVAETIRLTVLVPAHNEAAVVERCVTSVTGPNVDVVVIAHNCSDDTSDVAEAAGARVIRLDDATRRTKSDAISFALKESGPLGDAIAIVDADSWVSPEFYDVVCASFSRGEQACQVDNRVANPRESPSAALRFAGFAINHHVRGRGKDALRLSAGIFGTGFAVRRHVANSVPWPGGSVAEDKLFHLELVQRNIRVAFEPGSDVQSRAVTTNRAAYVQQRRWESAHRLSLARALDLVVTGARRRNVMQLHAGLEQFIPGQSVLLTMNVVGAGLGITFAGRRRVSAGLIGGQVLYVLLGLAMAGAPAVVYRSLFGAPLTVWNKVRGIPSRLGRPDADWTRTRD